MCILLQFSLNAYNFQIMNIPMSDANYLFLLSDFNFDWGGSVLDLPDELLEPSTTNGPSTSTENAGRSGMANHDGSMNPSSSSSAGNASSFNMANGPALNTGSLGHSAQMDSGSFSSGQQQQHPAAAGLRAPPSFGAATTTTTTNSGNSVLEELLLTNRASSSTGGGPSSGAPQHLAHHQQQNATTAPNVALAPMNQRTPPSAGVGMSQPPQNFVNRSPLMNNLASPPNGPIPGNAVPRPMTAFASEAPGSTNMFGGAPPQYGMPPNRLPPAGPQQGGMNPQQMAMGVGAMRGPPPSSMNGPQMNAGVPGPNMVRVQRPGGMIVNQQQPNQQALPFNAPMHLQQQQHMNAGPPMHMNVARMVRCVAYWLGWGGLSKGICTFLMG